MYKKILELISNELDYLIKDYLELKKIEIKGNKVKFVFLTRDTLTVKVVNYEIDLLGTQPILKFKNDYMKPFKDKYFR
jgi:hypothetical protein